jgi:ABC-type transport system involved in Fe-S cluster assembly fused permease/ATPase subunit
MDRELGEAMNLSMEQMFKLKAIETELNSESREKILELLMMSMELQFRHQNIIFVLCRKLLLGEVLAIKTPSTEQP